MSLLSFRYTFLAATVLAVTVLSLVGCDTLSENPNSGKTFEQATSSVSEIQTATIGNYGLVSGNTMYRSYPTLLMYMGEISGDNLMMSVTTPNPLQQNFTYDRSVTMGNAETVWQHTYQIIYSANQAVIGLNRLLEGGNLTEQERTQAEQLKGENLFLRAKTYHDAVRLFGRPYPQNPEQNLGVPLVDSTDTGAEPPRATVAEVYDQIVQDLEQASELMTMQKSNGYASTEAAWAVLSRVYLYMEENQKAIDYANRVIDSGRFELLATADYPSYWRMSPEENTETIFALHREENQAFGNGSFPSMFYTSPGGNGYGEIFASEELRDLFAEYPADVRDVFIEPQYVVENGDTVRNEDGSPVVSQRNGFDRYFMTKCTYQQGIPLLCSPVYIRLAEMYLNRAEAYAKLGMEQKALADVNRIRQRAGLDGEALYSRSNLHGLDSVLDAVLQERRLELYHEGHRSFDIFRNGRALERGYPSVIAGNLTIEPSAENVVYPIPRSAIQRNSNLEQNPGY
jgi:tetratricopeptide (TPR) repeat protein